MAAADAFHDPANARLAGVGTSTKCPVLAVRGQEASRSQGVSPVCQHMSATLTGGSP
jgi:hypothetical protein